MGLWDMRCHTSNRFFVTPFRVIIAFCLVCKISQCSVLNNISKNKIPYFQKKIYFLNKSCQSVSRTMQCVLESLYAFFHCCLGQSRDRIREDYLRILRYFRFFGRIARDSSVHDADTLAAIRENVGGLDIISGERIWMELKKIFDGNHAGDLVLKMIECGMAEHIGLPAEPDLDELRSVWERSMRENNPLPRRLNAVTLLSSLLRTTDDVARLNARLKVSAHERDLANFIVENRGDQTPSPISKARPYQYLMADAGSTRKVEAARNLMPLMLLYHVPWPQCSYG
jgi:hypothetical protein